MSRETRDDPPSLFDLPLQRPGDEDEAAPASQDDAPTPGDVAPPAEGATGREIEPEQSALFAENGRVPASGTEELDAEVLAEELDDRVLVRHRLLGGLFDLGVHAFVLGLILGATWLMGVWSAASAPGPVQWLAIGLFLLLFSCLYTVIPLAFWGRTPGMSRVHHSARAADGEPLTFAQTLRRWLGALLTLALAGLPLILAVGERPSPADRLSGSETHVE